MKQEQKTAVVNSEIYTLIWCAFYDLWSGNWALILQPWSPQEAYNTDEHD